jgi:hypothetical protein
MDKTIYSAMTIFGVVGFSIIWALNNAYQQ